MRTRTFFQSMRGQVFLLLVIGIIASVAITFALSRREHDEMLALDRAQRVSAQLAYLVASLDTAHANERVAILQSVRSIGIRGDIPGDPPSVLPDDMDVILLSALQERLGENRKVLVTLPSPDSCRDLASIPPAMLYRKPLCQLVWFALTDGTPATLVIRAPYPLPHPKPVWWALLLFTASIAGLAWIVARMATSPLQQLAEAADKLDITSEPRLLDESAGSSEVRSAARAFNRMQQRIKDDLRERTGMLAAITHDLQTPLTRLRLRLEKVQDAELRERLVGDMNAMQQMLHEGLEFARSMDANEPMQRMDLDSLLDSICSDALEANLPVHCSARSEAQVMAQPIALRRAIANLLDNAVKYGNSAEITLARDPSQCHIRIADQGPGIPPEALEDVFKPFFRLEHSRSRETGGTGLGLSIARNIVEQHGGQLNLSNRPEGGLEAHITLPLASNAE